MAAWRHIWSSSFWPALVTAAAFGLARSAAACQLPEANRNQCNMSTLDCRWPPHFDFQAHVPGQRVEWRAQSLFKLHPTQPVASSPQSCPLQIFGFLFGWNSLASMHCDLCQNPLCRECRLSTTYMPSLAQWRLMYCIQSSSMKPWRNRGFSPESNSWLEG